MIEATWTRDGFAEWPSPHAVLALLHEPRAQLVFRHLWAGWSIEERERAVCSPEHAQRTATFANARLCEWLRVIAAGGTEAEADARLIGHPDDVNAAFAAAFIAASQEFAREQMAVWGRRVRPSRARPVPRGPGRYLMVDATAQRVLRPST